MSNTYTRCCATVPAPRLKGAAELATLFKGLADETRLRILALLRDGEVCVCHIHAALQLPQPTVSRHLAYLRRTGLVEARRDGIWMHYQISRAASPIVMPVLDAALHALTHAPTTDRDLARLERQGAHGA